MRNKTKQLPDKRLAPVVAGVGCINKPTLAEKPTL
jgi:hypothetical protein